MDERLSKAHDLALSHWAYIEELLRIHGEDTYDIDMCRFHYTTAFVHGYKHAVQDLFPDRYIQ